MEFQIKKAEKKQRKARVAFTGPTGSGKTFSALVLAKALADSESSRFLVIDTEHSSAALYSDLFDFDTIDLAADAPDFNPEFYKSALKSAESAGYKVVVIDSLTHAWRGKGGALEINTRIANSKYKGNTFNAWNDTGKIQNELIEGILSSPAHIIVTMRSKMEYVQTEQEVNGYKKTVIQKVGLNPVQRDDVEYEFDLVADMDVSHTLYTGKTRCHLMDEKSATKPGPDFWQPLIGWLKSGVPETQRQAAPIEQPQPAPVADKTNQPVNPPQSAQSTSSAQIKMTDKSVYRPAGALAPAELKTEIERLSKAYESKPISDGKRGLIAPTIEKCFAVADAPSRRHDVQKYLTGKASLKDVPDAYLIALYLWLNPQKDSGGDFTPDPIAAKEAASVFAAAHADNPAQATLLDPEVEAQIPDIFRK